jgi:hypothetical protein
MIRDLRDKMGHEGHLGLKGNVSEIPRKNFPCPFSPSSPLFQENFGK